MKTIHITYHALLRERRGQSEETITTTAETPGELYEHLLEAHNLKLQPENLKAAVNHEMAAWDQRLTDGDTVTFIPPVAGG